MPAGTASSSRITALASDWTNEEILDLVQQRLGKRACWYQIEVAKAFYNGHDVIGCAPTGAGKTLSFWIPLLMAQARGHKKILFVVSPLNVLAKQNVDTLLDVGISAIAVAAENATAATFKEIEKGKYSVVVTNPEILMTSEELKVLWSTPSFTRRLLGFVFDEAHCIAQWGRFRKHYLAVGTIRYLVSEPFPVYIASATLPPPLLAEIRKLLHMNPQNTEQILCSNDRPDIALMVRELASPASSYDDLGFLIPYNWQESMETPKKFLVFFDNIKEAEEAKKYFHQRLRREYHPKIAWFHSTMSQEYRERKVEEFRRGELWGLFCTDAFGLGMDIGDVQVVVQYKATCDLCTLWQRFGRAARSPDRQGVGILLVEKKDTVMGRKGAMSGSKRNSGDLQTGRRQRQKRSGGSTSSQIPMDVDTSCQPTLSTYPGPDLASWSCERQARYSRPEITVHDTTNAKKGKAPGVQPGTAMDDYINLPSYVPCRRLVPQIYFSNDKRISDGHLLCDPAEVRGCQRCQPPTSSLCCDKCHPHKFLEFKASPLKKTTTPRRSIIPATYARSPKHSIQEEILFNWRHTQAVEHLGEGVVHRLGPHILMSDEVVERVMACWTFEKITNVSHLRRETTWAEEWIQVCGQSLVDLLIAHPPFVKPCPTACLTGPELAGPASSQNLTPTFDLVTPTSSEPRYHSFVGDICAPLLQTAQIPTGNMEMLSAPPVVPPRRRHAPHKCTGCGQIGHNKRSCEISKQVKLELMDPKIATSSEPSSTIPQATSSGSAALLGSSSGVTVAPIPSSTNPAIVSSTIELNLPPWYRQISMPDSYRSYPNWYPWTNYPQQQLSSQPDLPT